MTTLTMRMIKGDFVVTGPDVEPMKFKTRREARDWRRRSRGDLFSCTRRGAVPLPVALFWGRERSALRDPLNRPRRYAELRGDLMKSWPPRSRQGVADSLFRLGRHSGVAEGF